MGISTTTYSTVTFLLSTLLIAIPFANTFIVRAKVRISHMFKSMLERFLSSIVKYKGVIHLILILTKLLQGVGCLRYQFTNKIDYLGLSSNTQDNAHCTFYCT